MTILYNKNQLKTKRQKLRNDSTSAEKKLWYKLRNKQTGYRFRRQYSIGKYIVDFFCPELKFAIEVDGATHASDQELKKDYIRQKYIEKLGIKIKRYNNQDIFKNIDSVIEDIFDEFNKLK